MILGKASDNCDDNWVHVDVGSRATVAVFYLQEFYGIGYPGFQEYSLKGSYDDQGNYEAGWGLGGRA